MTVVPASAPRIVVPAPYNKTIAVCMVNSFIGVYICVSEQQPDGTWVDDSTSGEQWGDENFDATVAFSGSATLWLQNVGIPRVNAIMALRYPAQSPAPTPTPSPTPPPTTDNLTQIINLLAGCTLSIKNGVPGFF